MLKSYTTVVHLSKVGICCILGVLVEGNCVTTKLVWTPSWMWAQAHTHAHIYTYIPIIHTCTQQRYTHKIHTCTCYMYKHNLCIQSTHTDTHNTCIDTQNTHVHIHTTHTQRDTDTCTIHTNTHTCCVEFGAHTIMWGFWDCFLMELEFVGRAERGWERIKEHCWWIRASGQDWASWHGHSYFSVEMRLASLLAVFGVEKSDPPSSLREPHWDKLPTQTVQAASPGRAGYVWPALLCCVSRSVMYDCLWPHRLWPSRLPCPWDSPGKNTA